MRKRIGLALGGGGARGFAHIPLLKVLDEFEIRPTRIAGTSIGAIFGAMLASGMSGAAIHALVSKATISRRDRFSDILQKKDELLRWFDAVKPEFGGKGLIRSDRLIQHLLAEIRIHSFADLKIPLHIVASDFWRGERVVFSSGELLPAVRASMAVPGVFPPVVHEGRVLLDGGLLDLVPYDLLLADCDFTIAFHVGHRPLPADPAQPPSVFDMLPACIDVMQEATLQKQLQIHPPDVLSQPPVGDIPIFQFDKMNEIMERAHPAAEELRAALKKKLTRRWLRRR